MLQICYLQPHYKGEGRSLCICKTGDSLGGKSPESWVASPVPVDRVSEVLHLVQDQPVLWPRQKLTY